MSWTLSTTSLLRPSTPAWLDDVCQRLIENIDAYKIVELIHPRMDDRDAKTFAKALSENTTITTLVLSCYAIVDDGTAAIASVLCENKSITKLQLRDLRDVREISTFFQYLQKNKTITDMSMRHCTICPRGAVIMAQYLKQNTALRELRITDSQFISNAFQILCEQGLYRHPSLGRLYLVNDDLDNETSAEYLSNLFDQNSTIQEFYIGENNLGDDGVASIVRKIIQNNTLTTLRHLDLRSNNITCDGAMSLQGLIINNTSLCSLILSDNDIGDYGMMALSRGLQQQQEQQRGLRKLDVSTNNITKRSATLIATMLRANQSLHELNLSFNSLCDDGVATILAAVTATTINSGHPAININNTTLRIMSLRRNGITNIGAQQIGRSLPYMKGLKELYLSKNDINCLGVTALFHGLHSNVELEYLDVDYATKGSSASISHHVVATTSTATDISHDSPFTLQQKMVRCMKLNKAGRRIFRSVNTVPQSLWPLIYGRMNTDTDLLYHFLTTKPDVIQAVSPPQHPSSSRMDDPIIEQERIRTISIPMIDNTMTKTKTIDTTTKLSRTVYDGLFDSLRNDTNYKSAFVPPPPSSFSVNGDDENLATVVLDSISSLSSPISIYPTVSNNQISSPKRKKQKHHDCDNNNNNTIDDCTGGAMIRTCVTF